METVQVAFTATELQLAGGLAGRMCAQLRASTWHQARYTLDSQDFRLAYALVEILAKHMTATPLD